MAKYGFALEIGPIPNGIIRHDILRKAYDTALACLDFVENTNNNKAVNTYDYLEIYEHFKTVEFPKDPNGNINAVIHENVQDNDFKPLKKGDPIFERFDGEVIYNQEEEVLFPVFVNEAAYYYK